MKTGIGGLLGGAVAGVLLLLSGCTTTSAVAEEPAATAIVDRAVRLSYLEGDVRVALEGGSVWAEPRLNLTLTGGDAVRTAPDARTELDWGRGALRLGGDSEVELDRATGELMRAWLERGVAALRVRALDESETVAIGTRAGTVRALRTGDYRVEADEPDGDVLVIVRTGLAELDVDGRYYRVHPGEMLRMRAGEPDSMRVSTAFAEDGFDRWCAEREERIERSLAARYVPADVIGYEDLDAYGTWDYAPGYGDVWFPSVTDPGWTPYAFGSWLWVGAWGWTWIDSSPWGYAPYHYGRWVRYHDRWGWAPGPRQQRPPYRPAPEGWRQERPLPAGDGRVYRPPPPPREVPPRSPRPRDGTRPREETRVTIPERPLRPAPQPPIQRREPQPGGVPPAGTGPAAPPPAMPPPATPPPAAPPPGERPRTGRPESGELRREREREPSAEGRLQTRERVPVERAPPQPVPPAAPPAPHAAPAPEPAPERRQAPAAVPERPSVPARPAIPARPAVPARPAIPPPPAAPATAPAHPAPPHAVPGPAPQQQAPQQAPQPRPAPRRQEPRAQPE